MISAADFQLFSITKDRASTLALKLGFIICYVWIIFEISFAAFSLRFDMRHLWRYVGGWSSHWSGTSPSYAMATAFQLEKQPPSHMPVSLLVTDSEAAGYMQRMPCRILIYCAALHKSDKETPYFSGRKYWSTSSESRQSLGPIFRVSIQSGRWS